MSSVETILVALYGVVVGLCLIRHFIWGWAMRATPFLSPKVVRTANGGRPEARTSSGGRLEACTTSEAWPLVSVLIPAKDEEAGIRACLESVLAQDYPNFEILVADDRSADRTAEIVEEMAQRDPRLRLVRIQALPPGWTGKTNALQQLQHHARGEWLLFIDADTRHHSECLTESIRDATVHGADMLSLMPALDMHTFWERVVQPFAAMCLMILYPLPRVNDPKRLDMGFANGQFILVRRSAYDAIGQHTQVKDKFVEDIHLGRLIRRAGLNLRVAMAPDLVSVRMYSSLAAIRRGWARILYSGVDMKPGRLYVLLALILIFSVLGYVTLLGSVVALLAGVSTPFVWWIFGLAIAHEVLQETMFARIYWTTRSRIDYLVFRPLAVAVMIGVVLKAIEMCRTHRVEWRGTAYDQGIQAG